MTKKKISNDYKWKINIKNLIITDEIKIIILNWTNSLKEKLNRLIGK